MKTLILLVGNIGSGKTTYIKNRKFVERGYVIIARDRLRYNIGGGQYIFNPEYEPIIWSTELYMFRRFLELGKNIVVDEVGISKKMRARYITLAKEYGYFITCAEMPRLSQKEAVDRRMNDPHGQPDRKLREQVWLKFDLQYEPPDVSEGFDIIFNKE